MKSGLYVQANLSSTPAVRFAWASTFTSLSKRRSGLEGRALVQSKSASKSQRSAAVVQPHQAKRLYYYYPRHKVAMGRLKLASTTTTTSGTGWRRTEFSPATFVQLLHFIFRRYFFHHYDSRGEKSQKCVPSGALGGPWTFS